MFNLNMMASTTFKLNVESGRYEGRDGRVAEEMEAVGQGKRAE